MNEEHLIEEMSNVLITMTCTARMLGITQDKLDNIIESKSRRYGYRFD